MPAIGSLKKPKLAVATVELDGETVEVSFDRNAVTFGWAADALHAFQSKDARAIATTLSQVIHSWDITEEDGTPYPPVAANVESLPAELLGLIMDSIEVASTPSRAEGNDSSGPTSTEPGISTEPAATSQNGTATSPSPKPSVVPSLT